MAEVNEYEAERAARIAANMLKMQQLGLDTAAARFHSLDGKACSAVHVPAGTNVPRKRQKKAQPQANEVVLEASRQSRRIRGDTPLTSEDIKQLPELQAPTDSALGCTRKGRPRIQLTVPPFPRVAPFSLSSIGVTVWDLGSVYRGPWQQRYWSSSGCLFHHAYPVGFQASKVQFGRTYGMEIEAGPQGPIFKVTDQATGVTYSGSSPTKPWTDVCLAHKTGQRISGPLFFGFSDLVTQQAIAAMYTPQELQAALQGERLGNASLTPEERAAQEFRQVDGIGEVVAMVLALTKALGGEQHASLQALRDWTKQGDNAADLEQFLLHSVEVPDATRRWPAWRHRMVPQIIRTLLDIPAPSPQPAKRKAKAGAAMPVYEGSQAGPDAAALSADPRIAASNCCEPSAPGAHAVPAQQQQQKYADSRMEAGNGAADISAAAPQHHAGPVKATSHAGKENQAGHWRGTGAAVVSQPAKRNTCSTAAKGKEGGRGPVSAAGKLNQAACSGSALVNIGVSRVAGRKRQLTARFAAFMANGI